MVKKLLSLTDSAVAILRDKATEPRYSGNYLEPFEKGTYLCRQCGLALFRADNQFASACGWPSFDSELPGAILRLPDQDGRRTEILCHRCHGHLGHVFLGEGLTSKNLRHCVNSLSIEFVSSNDVMDTGEAIVAAGCFWGVQYYFDKLDGVLKTEVGYIGSHIDNPTYEDVCSKTTGHVEGIRVVYDVNRLSYEDVIKYFFEIHDPTQANGQGPDIGEQYLSRIFCFDDEQHQTAAKVIAYLRQHDCDVVTELLPMSVFWPAEEYHQDYYEKTGKSPYCHTRVRRFF